MKICTRCGKSYRAETKCECDKDRHKIYDNYQRDKKSADFYHSIQWRAMTQHIRQKAAGIDELLFREKKILRLGKITHHIFTVKERPDLVLNEKNLVYVSIKTHNIIHVAYEKSEYSKKKMQDRLLKIVASRR